MCGQYSYLCNNLSQTVKEYTLRTVTSIDQIMSFLQLSQSIYLIESSSNSTLSRREFVKMSKNVTFSIECLRYYFPSNYSSIYQKILELQIDNVKEFEKYLNMTSVFND